jgi:putative spermidine/putrescine transport system substrate-binding protein
MFSTVNDKKERYKMKKTAVLLFTMIIIASMLLASCAPKSTATEAAATEAVATEAPASTDCDWDEQTCAFLEGKDFGGRTLVVGVWGGVIEQIYRDLVIPEIEKHNGKVELLLGGTGDRTAKIYAEKGNPTMDVAYLNMYEAAKGVEDGVLEAPSNVVPAYDDLYPAAQVGGYGMSFMGLGIAYNPTYFDTPPDWKDFWDPKVAGKIATATFPGGDSEGLLAVAGYMAGSDENDPDAMFTKLKELTPFAMIYTSLDELFMMMDKGDVAIAPVISGYAWTYIDKGMNIKFAWPKDPGTIQMMDTLTIVKDTKNQDMAYAWAQLSLSPKTQQAFAEQIYFGPTNSKVVLTGAAAERCVYGQEKVDSLLRLSTYMIDNRDTLTERYNREILGQ